MGGSVCNCFDASVRILPLSKGAEANIFLAEGDGERFIVKERKPKPYRDPRLDEKIREQRTRQEATLIKKAGRKARVPKLIGSWKFQLAMEYIEGKRPEPSKKLAEEMGELLREIHSMNIIHNDFTPANVIETDSGLVAIDFGLGFQSHRIEDKASDLFTTAYSLGRFSQAVVESYGDPKVVERFEEIKKRARYMRGL